MFTKASRNAIFATVEAENVFVGRTMGSSSPDSVIWNHTDGVRGGRAPPVPYGEVPQSPGPSDENVFRPNGLPQRSLEQLRNLIRNITVTSIMQCRLNNTNSTREIFKIKYYVKKLIFC